MAIAQPPTIKPFISPLTTVARSDAESTLGSALSLVDSSHEAVLIFDDEDKFLGLVSLFRSLYASSFPYTTKVSSVALSPPSMTEETLVYEAAEHMLATKIYALPVFHSNGELQGIVHGKKMLQEVAKDPELLEAVSSLVEPHPPITAPASSSVRDIFSALKERGVSRMIIVDENGRLAGIVARSDLMDAFIKPTPRMRFPKEGSVVGFYSRAGEKKFRQDESIRKYYTKLVESLPDKTPIEEVVAHLITSAHNTIVLVDKQRNPTGFLSVRDILQAVALLRPEEEVPLIVRKPSEAVGDDELARAREHLERFAQKFRRRMPYKTFEVASEELQNPVGDTRAFKLTFVVTPVAGEPFVAVTKQRTFLEGVRAGTALIEKQRKRRSRV